MGQHNDLKTKIIKLKLTSNIPHTSDSVIASKTAEGSRPTGIMKIPSVVKATTPSDIVRVKHEIGKSLIIDLTTDDEENDGPKPNRIKRTRDYLYQ